MKYIIALESGTPLYELLLFPEGEIMQLDSALALFESFLLEKNMSPHTIEAYMTDLSRFTAYVEDQRGRSLDLAAVTVADIRGYLSMRLKNGLSNSSIRRQVSSIRSFFQYAHKRRLVKSDPAVKIANPKKRMNIPPVVTEKDIKAVMELPELDSLKGMRDRAVLEFLYSTGLRLSEMLCLNIKDIWPAEDTFKVRGKGGKERFVPWGKRAKQAFGDYLRIRFALNNPRNAVQIDRIKKEAAFSAGVKGRISRRTVQRIVSKYLLQASRRMGIEPSQHAACFRHASAQ